jgi:excisionase family DNA binding protein
MPEDDPFVTVPQIARELGVTEVSVRTWIRQGRLRAIKAGRSYRVRRSDLDKMTRVGGGEERTEPSGPVSLEDEPLMAQVVLPDGS